MDLRLRRKKKANPAMAAMAPTATATPMPALAPLLNPLSDGVLDVPVGSPGPVDVEAAVLVLDDEGNPIVDEAELVLDGEPSPTVVTTAPAEGRTKNTGLVAPCPAVVFGLSSNLQLEIPCHTSCMS